jgi:nicotinate phosphoribosyltransferase
MIPSPRLEPQPENYSLLTDLYQLTMSACYCGEGIADRPASFELFARSFPHQFGYAIAMGLEQALQYLEAVQFSEDQITALRQTGLFDRAPADFWDLLANFRFRGSVYAMPEGTAFLPNEPIVRIEAPLWQAQIVETYLLNTVNYQTLIATRAARMRDVAGDRATLLEFGTRRAASPQAALWAARAALAAGFNATSNVFAALELGHQPSGTMAHALVLAFSAIDQNESSAFSAFHQYFPGAPLLVDTFDTIAAVRKLAEQREAGQLDTRGIRIDSGDLVALSRQVREILPDVPIFASGDLDEWEIGRTIAAGAKIDGYGIGTRLVAGSAFGGVYKLVDLDGVPVAKRSPGKATYPGQKQVFRGAMGDRLGLANEAAVAGERSLLECVMVDGQRTSAVEPLETIAQRTAFSVAEMPAAARSINCDAPPSPAISEALESLRQTLDPSSSALSPR